MNFGGGMRRINGDQTTRVLPRCGKESRNGGIVDDFLSPKSWFSDSSLIRFSEIVYYWKATSWCISCRWMPIHDFPNIITWHYFVKTNHGPCFFLFWKWWAKCQTELLGVIEIARLYQRTLSILWFAWNILYLEIGDVIGIPFRKHFSKG